MYGYQIISNSRGYTCSIFTTTRYSSVMASQSFATNEEAKAWAISKISEFERKYAA